MACAEEWEADVNAINKPCHQETCLHYDEFEIRDGGKNVVFPLAGTLLLSFCQNCIYFERFNLFAEKT